MTLDFCVCHRLSSSYCQLRACFCAVTAEQLVLAEAKERGRVVFFTTVSKCAVPSSSEQQKEVSARAKCLSVPSGIDRLQTL